MRILFLCPDYFGIYKVIEKGIKNNIECELKSIIFEDYKYKNSFQKAKNFIYKTFLKQNLKKIWASKQRISQISKEEHFDYVFAICPDFLIEEDLEFVTKKTNNAIVYFWDSFENISRYEKTLPYFNSKYSFEPRDAKKFNMNFLTNFYFNTELHINPGNDVFYIGTYDKRFGVISNILSCLETKGITAKIYLKTNDRKVIAANKNPNIVVLLEAISIVESEKIFNDSKIILDVQKTIQSGLSFRIFEAMGHRKKLITTNTDIVNYDFYNPNNIFVWDESSIDIPDEFFESAYEELPAAIFEKYSIDNWVKTIFNIN